MVFSRYKNISKVAIKQKIEDISTASNIVDPSIYYKRVCSNKQNGDTKSYFEEISQLFVNREEEGQDEILQQMKDEQENLIEQNQQPVDKEKREKRGKELTEEEIWELSKVLNASKEGLSKPKNKILLEYLRSHPHLAKRTIDRKVKEIAISVYLVDPKLFESQVKFFNKEYAKRVP